MRNFLFTYRVLLKNKTTVADAIGIFNIVNVLQVKLKYQLLKKFLIQVRSVIIFIFCMLTHKLKVYTKCRTFSMLKKKHFNYIIKLVFLLFTPSFLHCISEGIYLITFFFSYVHEQQSE